MAKASTKPKKPAVAKKPAAAKSAEGAQQTTEFQAASGADGKAEGAAAFPAAPDAKAAEGTEQTAAAAADPAGTTDASAASEEETRGQADAAATDGKAAAEEEKQPEETAQPPVAEPYNGPVLVVTGPARGFRRGGFAFGADPVELTPAHFGVSGSAPMTIQAADRFFAIIEEPMLTCSLRLPSGEEGRLMPEAVAAVRARIETLRAGEGGGPIGELLEQLLDEAHG